MEFIFAGALSFVVLIYLVYTLIHPKNFRQFMTSLETVQLLFFIIVLLILAPPFGKFIAHIYKDEPINALKLGWLERLCYQLTGINPHEEMSWRQYLNALLLFNLLGFLVLLVMQLLQFHFHLTPKIFQEFPVPCLQHCGKFCYEHQLASLFRGKQRLSYITQMVGLCTSELFKCSNRSCCLHRSCSWLYEKNIKSIGNFWQDLVRQIIYIFLPLSYCLQFF